MWIVFYDMVLTQLRKEGVGKSVERSTDGGTPVAGGLSAFADTFFAENTAELAQRSARIFEETLGLVSLKVAARKSLVMATAWDRQPGGAVQRRLAGAGGTGGEFADAGRVQMGGELVPMVKKKKKKKKIRLGQ